MLPVWIRDLEALKKPVAHCSDFERTVLSELWADSMSQIIFNILRWQMGAFNKMCTALVSVGLLLGCVAPLQQAQQIIRCTDGDGQVIYTGRYDKESWTGYLVQVDESTRAFY